jgi:uncharacterized protein (DUF924 family)
MLRKWVDPTSGAIDLGKEMDARVHGANDVMSLSAHSDPEAQAADVLAFWRSAGPDKWFEKDEEFDAQIRARFLATYLAAAAGKLKGWANDPDGALALVIVLDQFPRNMFRDDSRAFAADALARAAAGDAIAHGYDTEITVPERRFFYLPFMHSEALADQERCARLCEAAGDQEGVDYARVHAEIIRRFGRFPHRNKVLGRPTTEAERAFLESGGFAG